MCNLYTKYLTKISFYFLCFLLNLELNVTTSLKNHKDILSNYKENFNTIKIFHG